jgi:hypothetical protein
VVQDGAGAVLGHTLTLGAWRRTNNITSWCDYAQVLYAHQLAIEAQRQILQGLLTQVLARAVNGASPESIQRQLRELAGDDHP